MSTRSNHTPGPWEAQGRAVNATIDGKETTIAGAKLYIRPDPGSETSTFADQETAEANAKLIAASPALRAFARDCRDNWDHDEDAHRYGTPCRKCEAGELLKRLEEENA